MEDRDLFLFKFKWRSIVNMRKIFDKTLEINIKRIENMPITKQLIYSRTAGQQDRTVLEFQRTILKFNSNLQARYQASSALLPIENKVDHKKQEELNTFYKKAQQLLKVENKEDFNFIMILLEKLETETQNVIGNRHLSELPVEIIKEVPNQSGFHTKFTVPCDGPGAYENFSKIKNQRYLLVKVINKFLFPHGINTKETVAYRGYVPPKEATQSIKKGNMYCDEGGYIDPSFIPHGMYSHLLQTYFLAEFFSKEGVSSFSFRDFFIYIGSTWRYWVLLMDNVMVPPPRKGRLEILFNSLMVFQDHYGREEDLFSLKNGTDNFTSSYFLTSFLLSPEAQARFPILHRMACLDCLSLIDSYRKRFNQHPKVTKKFAEDICYKGALEFPLTFRNAFNLLETMLSKYGPPTPEKYARVYTEYVKHFTEEPGIKTVPREFANPSEEEIDAWFPGENVNNLNTHLVNQIHTKENCSASTYFFSKTALLQSQSVTTAKEKVGQYDNKQLLYQR